MSSMLICMSVYHIVTLPRNVAWLKIHFTWVRRAVLIMISLTLLFLKRCRLDSPALLNSPLIFLANHKLITIAILDDAFPVSVEWENSEIHMMYHVIASAWQGNDSLKHLMSLSPSTLFYRHYYDINVHNADEIHFIIFYWYLWKDHGRRNKSTLVKYKVIKKNSSTFYVHSIFNN